MVAVYLVCTKPCTPTFESYPLMTSDCILNSNTNELKAAVNHRWNRPMRTVSSNAWSLVTLGQLVKMASLSLEISILVQIGVLI